MVVTAVLVKTACDPSSVSFYFTTVRKYLTFLCTLQLGLRKEKNFN